MQSGEVAGYFVPAAALSSDFLNGLGGALKEKNK